MLKRTILALLMASAAAGDAAPFRATLVRVFDGDTIEVRDESGRRLRVRLSGIDAPEREQPLGGQAQESLLRVLSAGLLFVDVESTDRYQHLLAKVICAGRDAALEQIGSGLAWFYPWTDSISATDRLLYSREEQTARALHRGLWWDRDPIPPWQFRRARTHAFPTIAVRCGTCL